MDDVDDLDDLDGKYRTLRALLTVDRPALTFLEMTPTAFALVRCSGRVQPAIRLCFDYKACCGCFVNNRLFEGQNSRFSS